MAHIEKAPFPVAASNIWQYFQKFRKRNPTLRHFQIKAPWMANGILLCGGRKSVYIDPVDSEKEKVPFPLGPYHDPIISRCASWGPRNRLDPRKIIAII